jgi:multiple sugar transport system substrate-binding protein
MRDRILHPSLGRISLAAIVVGALVACESATTTDAPSVAADESQAAPAATESAAPLVTPGEDFAGVEISFWSWVPGIQTQVDAFNASQSDIWVTYRNAGAGDAEYTALRTALETNTDVPDVVQIEYQHLPSFIARDQLLNLAEYGAGDVAGEFESWTVAQSSQGDGVFAYPQDAGPMIMMCNQALLDEHGIAVPTTWDEVVSASAALHEADPDVYLMNLTADQGHFFGLLWQSGARPFEVDGSSIAIDFTSPEVTRVAELWQELLDSGNLSPIQTYTNDWNAALAERQIACWTAGAWGPSLIESAAPDQSGEWRVVQMPQWDSGGVNGNYGGSAIAVTGATDNPAEAEAFVRWLTTDPETVISLTQPPANLFPVTTSALSDPEWTEFAPEFWGGETTHQTMAEAASAVDTEFGWSPFTDFVYTTYAEQLSSVVAGDTTFPEAMQALQEAAVQYASDQGFTVEE